MEDPIRLLHEEGIITITRFRPDYACYHLLGLGWQVLPLDQGDFSRQVKPLDGAHMQVIEARIRQKIAMNYAIVKPSCFLFILYRGNLEFFNQRSQLVSKVEEPCMYLCYDPASRYSLSLMEGLHSFMLLAFDKDFAFTNLEKYPMFAPVVQAWLSADTAHVLLPSCPLSAPMLEQLEQLRKIIPGSLEASAEFHTKVCNCVALYHKDLELQRDTLGEYKKILQEKVDGIISSLAIPGTTTCASHICASLGWSRALFDRISKDCYGTSVSRYIAAVRIEKACHMLSHTDENIQQIALDVGFAGLASFSKTFIRMMGISPRMYRKEHKSKK